MIIITITILLIAIYSSLIFYYCNSWITIPSFDSQFDNAHTTISVIIPARNEEKNIAACLQGIINQLYPSDLYEILVVDDFSTDRTAEVVQSYSNKNVTLISLQSFITEKINSYKKKAIEIAISQAKGDLIVTTDADCLVPKLWLQTIASFYKKNNAAFIAAPVSYFGENNFLKIFQSLDFIMLQGITGASVYKKFHSMCNGANLAYEKKVFYEVGGFAGIDNIASGDDMLLMHKIAERYPERVLFLKSPDAIVQTKPADGLQEFLHQRIRWASKADKYADKKITAVLVLVYLINVWIAALGVISLFYPLFFIWFAGALLVKTFVEFIFIYPVAGFFKKEKLLWWFAAAQPLHILYTIVAGWLGKFGSYKWKGRKVK